MATSAWSDFKNHIAVAKAVLSAAASVAATAMVVHSVVRPLLPQELQGFLFSRFHSFLSRFSNEMTMVIEDYGYGQNELFLASKELLSVRRVRVTKLMKEHQLTLAMDWNQVQVDPFSGVKLKWAFMSRQGCDAPQGRNSTGELDEIQYFELSFHKRYREIVVDSYLPFVLEEAKSIRQRNKTLKLYSNSDAHYRGSLSGLWSPVYLNHPATFETLAMDPELKKMLIDDLNRFVRRKEHYRRVGKAWKRGYLLYGPPGTGKSSLVAAMANYLKFNIYDLELSSLRSNANLKRLLVTTANRSILVVEDIDCTITLQDRRWEDRATGTNTMSASNRQEDPLTLSGFLNFIDGLWSSCGNERIIIFTTNHKERLDPALLRPGRMDVEVPLLYCTPCGFRLLASNYLGINHHHLIHHIESLLETARVTPAEVAEQLLKSDEPEVALRDMVTFIVDHKRKENEQVVKEKVCRCQLVEKNGGSEEDRGKRELIEE